MTITQLEYVLAVAKHLNFTKAAQHVFVTQPTLSMQVQKLEEELGVQIFNRTKKPIEITEVGKKIVEQAKNIVNESGRIQDIVDQEKGFVGGEFKLGIIPTVMPTLLPMFLKNFINKYPKVKLFIQEFHTEELIQKLKEGQLDAGIAATPLDEEMLSEKVLYYEPFINYIPAYHHLHSKEKLNPEDLNVNEILLLEDGHCFRENILNICRHRKQENNLNFRIKSGSFDTLVSLADEGLGMTLLPYLETLHMSENRKENLRNFQEPIPSRAISLIYNKNELKIHIINLLYNLIKSIIKGAIAYENIKIISPKSQFK